MSIRNAVRKAQGHALGFAFVLTLPLFTCLACDDPPPPAPQAPPAVSKPTPPPEPELPLEEVAPEIPPNFDADGILLVGGPNAANTVLPVLCENAGEINGKVYFMTTHQLPELRAFFENYYPDHEWSPGDGRFGFSLAPPSTESGGVEIVVAKGRERKTRIIVSPHYADGEKPAPPRNSNGEGE